MPAIIKAIEYYLPQRVLTNSQLAANDSKWTAEEIEAKTGIAQRHIASSEECASDLAVAAAKKLFNSGACRPDDIDYLLLCTQSPDYFLPTTACLLQERLGIAQTSGALDFNLGCSGFVYGLGLAKGLIETGQANNVLLITAETYSKYIRPKDMNVRTLFGDAAAATLVGHARDGQSQSSGSIGPFIYGTNGRGSPNLIVREGGLRNGCGANPPDGEATGRTREPFRLHMDGPEIFSFSLNEVPRAVNLLLDQCGLTLDEVQQVVFHQANKFMLEHLRIKLRIPKEKFCVAMAHCGNTVSATIPIALKQATLDDRLSPGDKIVLAGFGVGYSWGAALVEWAI